VKVDDRLSRARVESGHVIGYAGGAMGDLRLRLGGGYAWSNATTARVIAFPGFADVAAAKYDGETLHGFAEIGYAMGAFEPFAGIAAYRVKTDPFSEFGGVTALSGAGSKETFAHSQLGVRFDTGLGESLSARGSLAWQHGFGDLASTAHLGFNAGGPDFDVFGTALSRNAAALSLALVWTASANVEVSLGYDGEIGTSGDSHMGRAVVSFGF
jgi:outer membrane autotransporter protein